MIIRQNLKDLFPTFQDFQTGIITPAEKYYANNSEIINQANDFVPKEQIYNYLIGAYSNRYTRYNDDLFTMKFVNIWADNFVGLWVKLQPYVMNQLNQLQDIKTRGDNFNDTKTGTRTSNGTTETQSTGNSTNSNINASGNSYQPFNSNGDILIAEGDNVNDKSLSINTGLSNTTMEASTTLNNNLGLTDTLQKEQYNIIKDINSIITSKLSLYLHDFAALFNDLFNIFEVRFNNAQGPFSSNYDDPVYLLFLDLQKVLVQGDGIKLEADPLTGKIKISKE